MGTEGPTNLPGKKIEGNFPKTFSINFSAHNIESGKTAVGTGELVHVLNKWWEKSCKELGLDPEDERFENVAYYIIELAKNTLEYGGGGEVKMVFNPGEIATIADDNGPGFEDPNEEIEMFPYHGLFSIKDYADEFIIETNGKRFAKVPEKIELEISGETDKKTGTRVSFIKKLKIE